jgi:hypothetical protein
MWGCSRWFYKLSFHRINNKKKPKLSFQVFCCGERGSFIIRFKPMDSMLYKAKF